MNESQCPRCGAPTIEMAEDPSAYPPSLDGVWCASCNWSTVKVAT